MTLSVIVVHACVFACGESDNTKDFKKCEAVAYLFSPLYIYSLLFTFLVESKNELFNFILLNDSNVVLLLMHQGQHCKNQHFYLLFSVKN